MPHNAQELHSQIDEEEEEEEGEDGRGKIQQRVLSQGRVKTKVRSGYMAVGSSSPQQQS